MEAQLRPEERQRLLHLRGLCPGFFAELGSGRGQSGTFHRRKNLIADDDSAVGEVRVEEEARAIGLEA